tara:strand:+ start:1292 stop:1813 length:522 start_codon:yes stop_codon:yes gene_type:complete
MTDIRTMNLSDNSDAGMVQLNPSTSFITQNNEEKNVSENKVTMDSTPISELMGQPDPMEAQMMAPPTMASQIPSQVPMQMQMMAASPQPVMNETPTKSPESKNPFNLTDQQLQALLVSACTAAAISTPVQEKLATMIPQFLNDAGRRSLIGLGATGLVAAILFHISQTYVLKA